MQSSTFRTAAASAAILLSATAGLAQPRPVALSGSPAPGGGNYLGFGAPVLNGTGQVAFRANLTGGTSTEGIFAGTPGAIAAVARRGTPAPEGGNYDGFGTPVLNGAGQLAFDADLTGGTSTEGIFAGTPDAIAAVARSGNPAPGGGSYFYDVQVARFVFNDSGQVAFSFGLTDETTLTSGLFVGTPGAVAAVARVGTPAPGGGNYRSLSNLVLNRAGQMAFFATLTDSTSFQGLFAGTPGAVTALARLGNPAPGGGTYDTFNFGGPRLNGAGQMAFSANLVDSTSSQGLFVGTPGAVTAVARVGTPAPGGGNFNGFDEPLLNGAGQVAFEGFLTGSTSTRGIFAGTPGALAAVARNGDPAPGGGNYSDFPFLLLNGAGQVAFRSRLTGLGVTAANDAALFAGLPGAVMQIVREGDLIDVDPGLGVSLRMVDDSGISSLTDSGGQDGRQMSFNDNGLLVYTLRFTDGSSGVFTSVVPEPTALSLLAVAGAGLLRRRRA